MNNSLDYKFGEIAYPHWKHLKDIVSLHMWDNIKLLRLPMYYPNKTGRTFQYLVSGNTPKSFANAYEHFLKISKLKCFSNITEFPENIKKCIYLIYKL